MLSADAVAADYKPAGRTDWKVVAAAGIGGRKFELIEILPPVTAAATTAFGKSISVPFSGRPFPKRGIISFTTILFSKL